MKFNKKCIMHNTKKITLALSIFVLFLAPISVWAHQPRIVESRITHVADPEISKAYYGQLSDEPDMYIIEASESFDLYVNILVPDIAGQKKDVSAMVLRDGVEIAFLDGPRFDWDRFYEPFGADTYWMGPEYKARVEAGTYEIRVSSSNNDSKYSLAIGESEVFDFKEIANVFTIIPELKKHFFNESPMGFIASPFGWGLVVVMYLLAGIVGFVYRAVLKRLARGTVRGVHKNIGLGGRLLRLAICVGLLLWGITAWNPILIFFSGFALFEAVFSWCGFYAAIGKNSCPMER